MALKTIEHGHSPQEISDRLSSAGKPGFLKDYVYGGIDGTITTFAIISGVAGAGLSESIIITLGMANVLADGFSMAASNYSGTKSEVEYHRLAKQVELRHIENQPEGETEELRQILQGYDIQGSDLDSATEIIVRHKSLWINMMLAGEYGLSPFEHRPVPAAGATFFAFVICGSVPIIPFILKLENSFHISIAATALTFLCIGALKSRWSLVSSWKSAIETLLIGGTSAAIAYCAGMLAENLL